MAPLSSSPVATKTRGSRSRAVSFSDESDDDWMVPPTTKPVTETGSSTPTNSGQTVVPSSGNKLSELLAAKSKTAKRREAYTALSESLASESGEGATGAAIQMPEELAEQMEAPSWLTAALASPDGTERHALPVVIQSAETLLFPALDESQLSKGDKISQYILDLSRDPASTRELFEMGFLGTLLGRSASYDIPPVVLDWALKTALWAVFTKEIWGLSAGQQIVEIVSNSKTPLPPMFASLEYWTGLLLQLGAKKEIGMEDVMMSEFIPSLPAGSPPKETATRVTDAQLDTIALAIRIWILALARNTEMDSSVRLSCFKVFVKLSMDGLLHERHFIGCASALARLFQDMPPTEWNRMKQEYLGWIQTFFASAPLDHFLSFHSLLSAKSSSCPRLESLRLESSRRTIQILFPLPKNTGSTTWNGSALLEVLCKSTFFDPYALTAGPSGPVENGESLVLLRMRLVESSLSLGSMSSTERLEWARWLKGQSRLTSQQQLTSAAVSRINYLNAWSLCLRQGLP